jgi:uncharacterized protein YuzE
MKVTIDKRMNVGYVQFRKGTASSTIQVRQDLLLDLDKKGQVLGIEVLSLSEMAPALKSPKKLRNSKTTVRKRAA